MSVSQAGKTIEDSTARLLSTAKNARGLTVADVVPRVKSVLEKTFRQPVEEIRRQDAEEFIKTLHIDDLCLILACERGDEAAWNDLFTNFGATVRSAARKVTSNQDAAEDLAQSIWAELHGLKTNKNGKPSGKISYYSGRGSLAGWLRAVVAQLAIDAHRKISRLVQVEEDREFENLAHEADEKSATRFHSTEENPEQQLIDKRGTAEVENSLRQAVGELDAEDRLLIKLYYFDGLNLKQAGAVLGFHEATASRRVVKIQTNLRKRVEQILQTERGWQPDEIRRTLAGAASILQTDVEKMLQPTEKLQEN